MIPLVKAPQLVRSVTPSPLVSVITPCFNAEAYVGAAVNSVRDQTLSRWEHVVVDDGSTDRSAGLVAALAAADPRLSLVRLGRNRGVAAARNAGVLAADRRSRYLVFLDADDLLAPRMLGTLSAYLDGHPEVGLVHGAHEFIDAAGRALPDQNAHVLGQPRYGPAGWRGLGVRRLPPTHAQTPFAALFCQAGVVPSLCMFRREVYERTPGWDEGFGQHFEDTDLLLQMALRAPVHFVDEPLTRYRIHPGQHTAPLRAGDTDGNNLGDTDRNRVRLAEQEAKLYAKWRALARSPEVPREHRRAIAAAFRFREGRVIPALGCAAAARHLRNGEMWAAARFGAGAARRYLRSLRPCREKDVVHGQG